MRVIDAHHHIWDLTIRDQPWITDRMTEIRRTFTVSDLCRVAEPCGVIGSILVQCLAEPAETTEFLTEAAWNPFVLGVIGYVDLTAADVGDQLDRMRAGTGGERLVGLRHVVEAEVDPDWLGRADVIRGLRELARRNLVYDLLVRPDQIGGALTAVDSVPEGRFVIDHLGKPPIVSGGFEPWARHMDDMASRPNLTAKLSGLVTEADWTRWRTADLRPYVDHALEVFGPHRLMFGSDWPVCLLAAEYGQQLKTMATLLNDLSRAEQAAVFLDTAVGTYRLQIKEGDD